MTDDEQTRTGGDHDETLVEGLESLLPLPALTMKLILYPAAQKVHSEKDQNSYHVISYRREEAAEG